VDHIRRGQVGGHRVQKRRRHLDASAGGEHARGRVGADVVARDGQQEAVGQDTLVPELDRMLAAVRRSDRPNRRL
jgi:hypothetical protein